MAAIHGPNHWYCVVIFHDNIEDMRPTLTGYGCGAASLAIACTLVSWLGVLTNLLDCSEFNLLDLVISLALILTT